MRKLFWSESAQRHYSDALDILGAEGVLAPDASGAPVAGKLEQGFLAAKTLLATRPIFHRTDAAIRGHIFCTFLALVLRKELMDRLAARRSKLEWQRIIDDLADLSEIDVEQDGRRARLRTAPGPTIDPICRALGIALPPVFQEMPPAA